MVKSQRSFTTSSPSETFEYAEKFAQKLDGGAVLALTGELGSGKTLFTQGLAKGLGIKNQLISPTYILMRHYIGEKFNLYHVDLYRLESTTEMESLGLDEIWLELDNIVVIEWAEKMKSLLPKETMFLNFEYLSEASRKITVGERR
ncbi:tRNA (adenosine(37)-N6)-threonylcarbamoyltransferase complex ATPase subunit type 1 TsaE [Patescibacteria group bacterium]|nr:tRNA (adenosine(37)-N6)-threonylcarbamoyltransferase complex ATPase subunit type 1 TsaE [Patescibacteria group bacterium]